MACSLAAPGDDKQISRSRSAAELTALNRYVSIVAPRINRSIKLGGAMAADSALEVKNPLTPWRYAFVNLIGPVDIRNSTYTIVLQQTHHRASFAKLVVTTVKATFLIKFVGSLGRGRT